MIKNFKTYTLLIISLCFFACSDDNDVAPLFDSDIDTRVAAQLDSYKKTLVSSEFGWKVAYQPEDNTGIYNIFLKFNEDDTVEIVSDVNNGEGDLPSTFRVGVGHFPELIFENSTVFHDLFLGRDFGLGAEFEFLFDDVTENKVTLKSKTDQGDEKSKISLIKATAEDKEAIKSLQGLDNRIKDGHETSLYFRSIIVKNSADENILTGSFTFDSFSRVATISYLGAGNVIETKEYPIIITKDGFNFITPLEVAGQSIHTFTYDAADNIFVSADGDLNSIITHSITPGLLYFPAVNTFKDDFKFYIYFDNTSANYLQSTSDEFLNLGLASSFNRLDIRFDDAANGGISYFQFRMNDGSQTFVIFTTEIVENERFIFNFQQIVGDPTPINNMLGVLFNPQGFYIEKTNESRFTNNPSYLLTNAANPSFRFSVYGI
ncbi:DUF4302 domain-containing protein [Aquimarina hainanensis]|uniref:DUF4302 domain-containing protein n=1 Tax=Aquimarina hainanensis TaxID=1578017 RepID=A0ABW5N6T2_9FLAO